MDPKPTIYYPVPELFPDSRARFIQIANTCHALARSGVQVHLLTGFRKGLTADKVLRFYDLPPHPNLILTDLPMLRGEKSSRLRISWHGVFHTSLVWFLIKIRLRSPKPGLIFLRHLKLADFILNRKRLLNLPVVFEVHDVFHQSTDNRKAAQRIKKQEQKVLEQSDALILTSGALKNFLAESGFRTGPAYVASNAVRSAWLKKKETTGTHILYTGSLYPWKGVDTLIQAAALLPEERFLIIGGGDRLEELKDQAAQAAAGRIEFTGPLPHDQMPGLQSRAKIAVLPNIPVGNSHYTSPLKLFEYMAQSLTIAAADIPVFREVLRHDENAVLFSPGDPQSLAREIQGLIDQPDRAARIGKQAGEEAAGYTYENRAQNIIRFLESCFFIDRRAGSRPVIRTSGGRKEGRDDAI